MSMGTFTDSINEKLEAIVDDFGHQVIAAEYEVSNTPGLLSRESAAAIKPKPKPRELSEAEFFEWAVGDSVNRITVFRDPPFAQTLTFTDPSGNQTPIATVLNFSIGKAKNHD